MLLVFDLSFLLFDRVANRIELILCVLLVLLIDALLKISQCVLEVAVWNLSFLVEIVIVELDNVVQLYVNLF